MSSKKMRVSKGVRLAVAVVLGLLFVGSLCSAWALFRKPSLIRKKTAVMSYRQKGAFSYSVRIRPNSVFPVERLGPGGVYFTKVVEAIDVGFSYLIKADKTADLKATYRIVAAVEAPKMWRKEFTLVPSTEITTRGDVLAISRTFVIDLPFYNSFLKAVNEELGATPGEPRLVVSAPVEVEAATAAGVVRDRLAPEMVIPLQSGCFKVGGTLSPEKKGELTAVRQVVDHALGRRRVAAGACTVAAGVLLVLWPLVTEGCERRRGEWEYIVKNCGDRVVLVGAGFSLPDGVVAVPLDSSEDLLRVADELGKPVIYLRRGCHGQACYLVLDGCIAYRYLSAESGGFGSAEANRARAGLRAKGSAGIPASGG